MERVFSTFQRALEMTQKRVNDTQLAANCTIKLCRRPELDHKPMCRPRAASVRFGQLMASTYRKIKSADPKSVPIENPIRLTPRHPLMVIIRLINLRSGMAVF